MKKSICSLLVLTALLLCSCHRASVPGQYKSVPMPPTIYPDYIDVTVPVNIAPLCFELLVGVDEAVTRFSASGVEIVCDGIKACPSIDEWRELTAKASGSAITVEVYAKKDGAWVRFQPFQIHVSADTIDPWLSYRLISPSYVAYEELTINQRCLETFEERVIVDNMLCSTESGGQCINCHSYQQGNPRRMQFHARQSHGGTVIAYDDRLYKVNLQREPQISAAVYPAWHPTLPLIAYSTNKTMQTFHTVSRNKVEVIDAASDLVLYDVERDQLTSIDRQPDELETFPCWSPDGKYLYFCSAHFEYHPYRTDSLTHHILVDTRTPEQEITMRSDELKYQLYRLPFNPATRQFGERELVFSADTIDHSPPSQSSPIAPSSRLPLTIDHSPSPITHHPTPNTSATLPRISPDGRWLLFTVGSSGCFHIWHHDADLWIVDLKEKGTVNSEKFATALDSSATGSPAANSSLFTLHSSLKSAAGSPAGNSSLFTLHSSLKARPLDACNSDDTESFHSWSSNSRWIVFSSRRGDGVFTRPFIAHIDSTGQATKPFELPACDPDYHRQLLKSYNVPELMTGPVNWTPQDIARVLKH